MSVYQISHLFNSPDTKNYFEKYEGEISIKTKKYLRVYMEEIIMKAFLLYNHTFGKQIIIIPDNFLEKSIKFYCFTDFINKTISNNEKYLPGSIYALHKITWDIELPIHDFLVLNPVYDTNEDYEIDNFQLIHFDIDLNDYFSVPQCMNFEDCPDYLIKNIPYLKFLIENKNNISCIAISDDFKKPAIPYGFTNVKNKVNEVNMHEFNERIIKNITIDTHKNLKIIHREELTDYGHEFINRFLFCDTLIPATDLLFELENGKKVKPSFNEEEINGLYEILSLFTSICLSKNYFFDQYKKVIGDSEKNIFYQADIITDLIASLKPNFNGYKIFNDHLQKLEKENKKTFDIINSWIKFNKSNVFKQNWKPNIFIFSSDSESQSYRVDKVNNIIFIYSIFSMDGNDIGSFNKLSIVIHKARKNFKSYSNQFHNIIDYYRKKRAFDKFLIYKKRSLIDTRLKTALANHHYNKKKENIKSLVLYELYVYKTNSLSSKKIQKELLENLDDVNTISKKSKKRKNKIK